MGYWKWLKAAVVAYMYYLVIISLYRILSESGFTGFNCLPFGGLRMKDMHSYRDYGIEEFIELALKVVGWGMIFTSIPQRYFGITLRPRRFVDGRFCFDYTGRVVRISSEASGKGWVL